MLPVWNLAVTRPFGNWRVVALFNFSDAPKSFEVPLASLGLDPAKAYVAHEFWGQKTTCNVRDALAASDVPMRTVRLFAIREMADHPQFIGDDRHITQGAVEVGNLAWDAAKNTYAMTVKAVAGFPFTYLVRVPDGYAFASSTAENGVAEAKMKEPGVLAVKVSAAKSGDVAVKLAFTRK